MGASTLTLIVEKGPREGETLDCRPGSVIRIGRVVKGNTFTIKDVGISSKHLLIEFKDGKWVVSDLETSNGTLLNNVSLRSMTPSDLRVGDIIKIGEYTSIKVKIEEEFKADKKSKRRGGNASVDVEVAEGFDADNGVLRRNPRRGVVLKTARAPKDEPSESASKVQKVPERSNLGVEKCSELETVAPVADKRGGRAASKRTRALKGEPLDSSLASISEVQKIGEKSNLGLGSNRELGNVVTVAENQGQRGRPKKTRALKNEPAESQLEVQKVTISSNLGRDSCQELENVSPEKEKQRRGVALKRFETSKEGQLSDYVAAVSEVQKIPESSNLDKENCRESGNVAHFEKNQTQQAALERAEASWDEPSESVPIPVYEAQKIPEVSNLQQETCKESGNTSVVKESPVKVDDEINLEKMTLGEWFDYLEVHLPKQIYESTEEMISSMRDRAKQFHEFMSQHLNGKGKVPAA